jgi:hypothetical protein
MNDYLFSPGDKVAGSAPPEGASMTSLLALLETNLFATDNTSSSIPSIVLFRPAVSAGIKVIKRGA